MSHWRPEPGAWSEGGSGCVKDLQVEWELRRAWDLTTGLKWCPLGYRIVCEGVPGEGTSLA